MSHLESQKFLSGRVIVKLGDITKENVDVVVNAANSTLRGGGGVDGAIHGAGGPQILEECRELRRTQYPNGLPTGKAVLTSGGNLSARYVIHTVGPIYGQHAGKEAELLADCYRNSLALASSTGLATIAFPAISTGIYGYPRDEAAVIASRAIEEFLSVESILREVLLIFFQPADLREFRSSQSFTD